MDKPRILSSGELEALPPEGQLDYINRIRRYSTDVEKRIVSLETEKAALEKQAAAVWKDLNSHGIHTEEQLESELRSAKEKIEAIHRSLADLE